MTSRRGLGEIAWPDDRRVEAVAAMALAAVASVCAYVFVWRPAPTICGFRFCDFTAYWMAAERLIATGTPYTAQALTGSAPEGVASIPVVFPYPPLLAQVFAAFGGADPGLLGPAWVLSSFVAMLVITPLLYRSGGGSLSVATTVVVMASALLFVPLQVASAWGNFSGWLAVSLGLILLAGDRTAGFLAAIVTAVKLQPLPILVIIALRGRRAIEGILFGIALGIAIPILLAPHAWSDWLSFLPGLARLPSIGSAQDLSPGGHFPGVTSAVALRWAPAVGLMVVGAWYQVRRTDDRRALLAATAASIVIASPVWQHYLALLFPFLVVLWPSMPPVRRALLAVLVVVLDIQFAWLPISWALGPGIGMATLLVEVLAVGAFVVTLLLPRKTDTSASGPLPPRARPAATE